ncbi:glycosyltransferase family 25 protein [Moritella dasanensis]|uniref:glycosyltransferase family 25 protein n=1 Tax=Moritella dasanensis TaxID=428031 RepID=UPI00031142EF|nr:glycosyltransferase family 25 protein [Moritella dasanensis]
MNSDIFIINLDKSTERLATSTKRLEEAGVSFSRIKAVFGADLSEAEKTQHYDAKLNRELFYRELNDGEIGAYLSHRKAWQTIVDRQLDYAIIFEDDFILQEDIKRAKQNLDAISFDWDYIKLAGYYSRKRKQTVIFKQKIIDMDLIAHSKVITGASATAVSYNAAIKLLASTDKFGRPLDTDLQHWWEKGIHIFCLLPYISAPDEEILSEIDNTGKTSRKKNNRVLKRQYIQIKKFFLNRHHNAAFLAKYNNTDS